MNEKEIAPLTPDEIAKARHWWEHYTYIENQGYWAREWVPRLIATLDQSTAALEREQFLRREEVEQAEESAAEVLEQVCSDFKEQAASLRSTIEAQAAEIQELKDQAECDNCMGTGSWRLDDEEPQNCLLCFAGLERQNEAQGQEIERLKRESDNRDWRCAAQENVNLDLQAENQALHLQDEKKTKALEEGAKKACRYCRDAFEAPPPTYGTARPGVFPRTVDEMWHDLGPYQARCEAEWATRVSPRRSRTRKKKKIKNESL